MTPNVTHRVESGRVHIYRVDGDPEWSELSGRPHTRDRGYDGQEEPRYVVQVIDLHDSQTWLLPAHTLNVNGTAFASGDGSVEFGAGAHKRVYRDPNDQGLVRILIQPKRT
jgi:hypothetical protein